MIHSRKTKREDLLIGAGILTFAGVGWIEGRWGTFLALLSPVLYPLLWALSCWGRQIIEQYSKRSLPWRNTFVSFLPVLIAILGLACTYLPPRDPFAAYLQVDGITTATEVKSYYQEFGLVYTCKIAARIDPGEFPELLTGRDFKEAGPMVQPEVYNYPINLQMWEDLISTHQRQFEKSHIKVNWPKEHFVYRYRYDWPPEGAPLDSDPFTIDIYTTAKKDFVLIVK